MKIFYKTILLLIFNSPFIIYNSFSQQAPGIEWAKCYGGSLWESASSIKQTFDGGYIAAGEAHSNDSNVSGNHGVADFWVIKINNLGDLQWQKCLGGSDWETAHSVVQTNDSGYIVAGDTQSNDGDVNGNHGGTDVWIVKLDSSGNIQWQKCLGGNSGDQGFSIRQTVDDGYIVGGLTSSNNGDVSGNHGGPDGWVVKLDNLGNIQWQKCLGGTDGENIWNLMQTQDAGYIIAASTWSNDFDVSGNNGYEDAWAVKLDSVGNIQWQNCLGGSAEDVGISIHETPDSAYIMCVHA
ncbi:MAG: hypothetical protein ACHQFW_10505, partial [Chitinophagales bacterium]